MVRNKIIFLVFYFPVYIFGQNISTSPHNLSASSSAAIHATNETELCVFCHTPHNSSPKAPLWNREDPGMSYTVYNSSTSDASIGQPDGASLVCLSCHDGTIALGHVLNRMSDISFNNGITALPPGESNLSTDLSDDHPISFVYSSVLSSTDPQLKDPNSLASSIKLPNGKLQCTSCHDPHDNSIGNFLVMDQLKSELCKQCHQMNGWGLSSHSLSTATWNGNGNDPFPNTDYLSVDNNACESCHTPHNASGKEQLMNYATEEDNCLVCHSGNVASKNIQNDFLKPYKHNIFNYQNIHEASETLPVNTMHIECTDCHNPHSVNNQPANAPLASGYIQNVKGIDSDGNIVNTVVNEYEVCYKCHADSPNRPGSTTSRVISQNNVRLEFDPNNPSYHPIEAPGKNPNVISLLSPYTEASQIYCSSCHGSDNANNSGPHGSIYPSILKYKYSTQENTSESYQNYELCYQCHNRNKIINSMSKFGRKVHREHIVGEKIPCNDCHDPHGISSSQGNSTNNSHLINFNTAVVKPYNGVLKFEDLGNYKGRCYLSCHGENHRPKSY